MVLRKCPVVQHQVFEQDALKITNRWADNSPISNLQIIALPDLSLHLANWGSPKTNYDALV